MPHVTTHILIPLVIAELFRDYSAKKKFPLHYVLIAGIAGIIPDLDIPISWLLNAFGAAINTDVFHRTITHTLLFLAAFLLLALISSKTRIKFLSKHKLTLAGIFLAISFGVFAHLIVDATIDGSIMPFYPFSNFSLGINLIGTISLGLKETILSGIDAIILIAWLIHEEIRHKISRFY